MANISLRTESLMDAARKIEDAASRIDDAIGRIDNIESDMDTVWKDENARTYLSRYDELKQDFPAFKEAAHNYSEFLYKVVKTYQEEFTNPVSESVN